MTASKEKKITFAQEPASNDVDDSDPKDWSYLPPTKSFLSRYKALAVMGNNNKIKGYLKYSTGPSHAKRDSFDQHMKPQAGMQSTLTKRKVNTHTMRRVQAEINDSPRDHDIMRLQQELKLSNTTARELDEVILYKNQGVISEKATQAKKVMGETEMESGYPTNRKAAVDHSITMEERLQKASVYIKDAIAGRETVSRSPLGVWYPI